MAEHSAPVSWFLELFPDPYEQGRVASQIGGPKGLKDIYDTLIVKSREGLKGAIDHKILPAGKDLLAQSFWPLNFTESYRPTLSSCHVRRKEESRLYERPPAAS